MTLQSIFIYKFNYKSFQGLLKLPLLDISNYRHISLLCISSKILENTHMYLKDFILNYNIISYSQLSYKLCKILSGKNKICAIRVQDCLNGLDINIKNEVILKLSLGHTTFRNKLYRPYFRWLHSVLDVVKRNNVFTLII